MNRSTIAVFAGLLAFAVVGPTFATDLPQPAYKAPAFKAPTYAPLNWTGFYVGLNGGYGWGNSTWTNTATNNSFNVDGALLGDTVGYNLQVGALVWGLEGDFGASWIKGSNNAGGGVCSGSGCESKNSWLGTARGRIGYAADRWLPYITGGLGFGGIKMSPNNGASEATTKVGWTVGGGVEYALSGPWSTKLEYLYVDLGKANCSLVTCGTSTDVNFTTNIVRAGLNYRF